MTIDYIIYAMTEVMIQISSRNLRKNDANNWTGVCVSLVAIVTVAATVEMSPNKVGHFSVVPVICIQLATTAGWG